LVIWQWFLQDEHLSAIEAKPEIKYLYGSVVLQANTALNAGPIAKPENITTKYDNKP